MSAPTHKRISYNRFRCGLSFASVRSDLAIEQRERRQAGQYMFVTRHTVLGRMRQIKLAAYAYYLREIKRQQQEDQMKMTATVTMELRPYTPNGLWRPYRSYPHNRRLYRRQEIPAPNHLG